MKTEQSATLQAPRRNGASPADGRVRAVIEGVTPEVDNGRFPAKRIVGDLVVVECDAFTDGHDVITCVLRYRPEETAEWTEVAMDPLVNDRWRGEFLAAEAGRYCYTIEAWVDHFKSWVRDLAKRVEAGQEVAVDLQIGAGHLREAAARARGSDATRLKAFAATLRAGGDEAVRQALSPAVADLMARYPDRSLTFSYGKELVLVVDRERARFSTWYELFPRSWSETPGRHGTFRDVARRLDYVAEMGFDVLYLPPIHPIGLSHRKGPNNNPIASPGDPGSPWAIGAPDGGHRAAHPDLGSLADFRALVERAATLGIQLALDLAVQCSPDHPYVQEHPDWFRSRPDGTIQYAENPPKKYQDIYPVNFETEDWPALWEELGGVVRFWIDQGVCIFRVDNPHTKPFAFWEWLIADVKRDHPEVLFLAEAFTRPKVMYRLAKLGFTQSYTYFAWRNTAWELTEYFTELTQTPVREFFRPNAWPNTPDILTEYLQLGGPPAFKVRLVLAATLAASYGIYGPAFEHGLNVPREPGSEEYLNSEKYEVKHWDLDRPDSLKDLIARVNRIRRENPALQSDWSLRFHPAGNDQLIAYSKTAPDGENMILTVVNLDPHHVQSGFIELPLHDLGIDPSQTFQVEDLLGGTRFLWNGPRNFVDLDPKTLPALILRIRRRVRREQDFEYFY
jgi:starch synthase (maltosyl-transferring)